MPKPQIAKFAWVYKVYFSIKDQLVSFCTLNTSKKGFLPFMAD